MMFSSSTSRYPKGQILFLFSAEAESFAIPEVYWPAVRKELTPKFRYAKQRRMSNMKISQNKPRLDKNFASLWNLPNMNAQSKEIHA